MTGLVEEMIGHQKIVKAFGREEAPQKSFDEINENCMPAVSKHVLFPR
ncbi:MAG: hypothetical protein ACLUVV_02385 [Christensenellales bacterium]